MSCTFASKSPASSGLSATSDDLAGEPLARVLPGQELRDERLRLLHGRRRKPPDRQVRQQVLPVDRGERRVRRRPQVRRLHEQRRQRRRLRGAR